MTKESTSFDSARELEPFKGRLTAVEYRLRRCLASVTQSPPPPLSTTSVGTDVPHVTSSSAGWMRVRQLGAVTNAAMALLDDIAFAKGTTTTTAAGAHTPGREPSAAEWGTEEVSADAATFYAEQLAERYYTLVERVQQAREQLQHYATLDPSFDFPLSCVGATAHALDSSDACGVGVLVEDGRRSASVRTVPAAQVEVIACSSVSRSSGNGAVVASANTMSASRHAEKPVTPSSSLAVGSAATTTAEDAVVNDIKRAVQQMKDGAMHMGELMRKEGDALKASEELMVGGLQKVQQGSRDVDKLTDGATRRTAPSFMRALPGGAMVWQHVLLPLWDVAKQALLLSLVIAITGCAFMLMMVLSKPEKLRLRQ